MTATERREKIRVLIDEFVAAANLACDRAVVAQDEYQRATAAQRDLIAAAAICANPTLLDRFDALRVNDTLGIERGFETDDADYKIAYLRDRCVSISYSMTYRSTNFAGVARAVALLREKGLIP
jgi:hypothetical protein